MGDLKHIGFSNWFSSRIDNEKHSSHEIARVVSVHKESYTVTKGDGEIFAEPSGNLLYSSGSAIDLPTTGDWVYADFHDNDTHAIIYGILPRKTLLTRKAAGREMEFQLVAANIDVAFIIQSLNEDFNLQRLERYLVMVNESGIKPIVLLSKSDLMSQEEIEQTINMVDSISPGVTVMAFSNLHRDSIDSIINSLQSSLTYCLLGSSGVGKTTLLNSILGRETFATKPVSKTESRGRHTTTTRQLVLLENGAMIIDTPGMRELGGIAVDDGLNETFAEILELSKNCKFNNCSHTKEKGCAIQSAIESGELSARRYHNYQKMKRESEFNQMSYLEKRNKERSFGKMVKEVMKSKKR